MIRNPMKPKKPRLKTCPFCRERYQPDAGLQVNCCHKLECRSAYIAQHVQKARSKRVAEADKAEREDFKRRKDNARPLSYWADRAQAAVNAYRRELFDGEPCISCGRHHHGQYHAGHFINRGSHPELRFMELNIWKQCKPCNVDLSGNKLEFRKALVSRIGEKLVEWLEGPHPQKKYTRDDLQKIEAEYKQKLKALRQVRAEGHMTLADLALAYPETYGEYA